MSASVRKNKWDDLIRGAIESIKSQGPCAFCGGDFAAHRVIDSEIDLFMAGETLSAVAMDFNNQGYEEMLARWIALAMLTDKTKPKKSRKVKA
jgi:hypothetical protein